MRTLSPLILLVPMAHGAIHVSPSGNDSSAGTSISPVASPQKALKLSVKKNDPTILFDDGHYFSPSPLTISAKYSGTKHKPRIFKAKNEGKVIFSAGQEIEVDWKPYRDGIFQANVPTSVDLSQGCDGLYIPGQAPRLARFPNYNKNARWLKGASAEAFSPSRIKTWNDPTGGILHAMHPAHWGGNHWTITGKKSATECHLEGGWMNNRGGGIHPTDRFVENIFEELDTESEWYLDKKSRTLYFKPEGDFQTGQGKIILSKHESCIRMLGTRNQPVQHVSFEGISFRHTARTFMKTKEPLLRSDWKIYRGGAVYLEGTQNVTVKNCEFTQLGGNAYFASRYNKNHSIFGCHFHHIGAGAINFIGDTKAVYNPMYDPYGKPTPFDQINKKDRGPQTKDYPSHCIAEDCLIHDIGLVEKQVAGLQISVAHKITGKHLSIYDVPRAGINISENAFGGHLIEYCDVFNTVQESADHGSFNSWGRDRFWHTNYGLVNQQVAKYPKLPLIDMLDRNVIRNSRWRCDHGWDIDLDDGSSGYLVENNLCLGGGIKLREGYHRIVRNNLVVANTFHPHVWLKKSEDIIEHNIWATPVEDIQLSGKGKRWDHNIQLTKAGLAKSQTFGVDQHGVITELAYTDPATLDFTFKPNNKTQKAGFKPFDLTKFGVQKTSLKSIARTPQPPTLDSETKSSPNRIYDLIGAQLKNVTTLGEVSATGLPDQNGALLKKVKHGGKADQMRLKANDVIRAINGKPVNSCVEFIQTWSQYNTPVTATVWRTQRAIDLKFPPFPGITLSAANATIHGTAVYDKKKNYIGRWTDTKTSLTWSATLKPNTTYRVFINQATPNKKPLPWKMDGLATVVDSQTFDTGGWEDFKAELVQDVALSKQDAQHTLRLSSQKIHPALMNFRTLILVEQ